MGTTIYKIACAANGWKLDSASYTFQSYIQATLSQPHPIQAPHFGSTSPSHTLHSHLQELTTPIAISPPAVPSRLPPLFFRPPKHLFSCGR
ncbi:hypothetical protein E2C01_039509 [Portunus trituberculatus]|uniref:Uncharacterized protein n=1 Tax=Portunus trituberculatus TaxID=210409 RepID=A0A5B7FN86_PORTR|nr:hypothetical protein [Portunus trituberculatus]